MALVSCTECGGKISTKARHCPSCGATNADGPTRKLHPKIIGGAMIFVAISAIAIFIVYERLARENAVQQLVMCARVNGMSYFTEDFANQQVAILTENGTGWREAVDTLAAFSGCPQLAHNSD